MNYRRYSGCYGADYRRHGGGRNDDGDGGAVVSAVAAAVADDGSSRFLSDYPLNASPRRLDRLDRCHYHQLYFRRSDQHQH